MSSTRLYEIPHGSFNRDTLLCLGACLVQTILLFGVIFWESCDSGAGAGFRVSRPGGVLTAVSPRGIVKAITRITERLRAGQ